MERYLPLVQRVIAQHTARWLEQGEVDLYQEMRELTFHVAASALVGLERSQKAEQLQKLFYTLIGELVSSLQNYDEHLPKALRARDELSGLLFELIAERRCIRVHFATIEVKALAAHVLRFYHLEPRSSQFPMQFGFTTTVVKNGIPMGVIARHHTIHDDTSERR